MMDAAAQNGLDVAAPASGFAWPSFPYPALVTAAGIAILTTGVLVATRHFDPTGGLLTLSIMIVLAFIAVTLASMLYTVPQTPLVEILIGALATSVGAIVAFWMSAGRRHDKED